MSRLRILTPIAAVIVGSLLILAPAAQAQDVKLPRALTLTAYDTGSSGFNIAVAVGKMLKDKHGTDVRVLPAGNDVARLAPLRANRAQASAMGIGVYFAQEGLFEFATKEWGPQPLQVLLASIDCNALSLGAAKDTGVKEVKDLKGKRVGFVVGAPSLNQNALAVLAYGGLSRSDVTIVEFAGYGAMWKGMVNNDVDAAFASTISAQAKEVETSPRGIIWPPLPPGDKAAWERVQQVGPYFTPIKATCGAAISTSNPVELGAYPYPIFTAYGSQPEELVYGMTKAMIVDFDVYKDGAPGAAGLALKEQKLQWVLPSHPGAVKAIKEAGSWSEANEAHNQNLLKRQAVLGAAWAEYLKANPPEDRDAFRTGWMTARRAALKKSGQPVGIDE